MTGLRVRVIGSIGLPLVVASVVVSAAASMASGPTPLYPDSRPWPKSVTALEGRWSSVDPPGIWLKDVFKRAAHDSNVSRSSKAPTFSVGVDDGAGTLYYIDLGNNRCAAGKIACAGADRDEGPRKWHAAVLRQGTKVCSKTCWQIDWCEHPRSQGGCIWARRMLIHELGHVLDFTHWSQSGCEDTPGEVASLTVMCSRVPGKRSSGGIEPGAKAFAFQLCDRAAFQLAYDVEPNESYSRCLPGAPIGSEVSFSAALGPFCLGEPVPAAGRLKVRANPSLGPLAKNPLGARTVTLEWRRGSSGPFMEAGTVRTDKNGRWKFQMEPEDAGTYAWRVRFEGDRGVAATSTRVERRWKVC